VVIGCDFIKDEIEEDINNKEGVFVDD